ncbi:MAG TPA: HIT domain-containing protein [Candidatus Saccharimonadales bacterium]|nr:HIT domain-containing protein [Candidatus Saccharimonadales bacterium]
MQDSIFTKIIKGEIPCHKIYEDDKTLAFLDIHPVASGHTLVIPKNQVEFVWDLEAEDYQAVMATVQKVGRRLREVIATPYVGVSVVGTDVPHAHVHVVPFNRPAELKRTFEAVADTQPDHEALAAVAAKLAF